MGFTLISTYACASLRLLLTGSIPAEINAKSKIEMWITSCLGYPGGVDRPGAFKPLLTMQVYYNLQENVAAYLQCCYPRPFRVASTYRRQNDQTIKSQRSPITRLARP